jgi:two-component system NtrC family sensor kinase
VEITRKRCAGNVMIDGDPAQIEQLFYNLMNSAEHALKRWTGRRTISVVSELADCRVVVRVSDSGPPVPEEMRSRVFDPFVAARSTSGESGLGLCMVAEIALAHGGSVELEGGDGSEATTFKVSLPVRRRGSPASGPRSSRT